MSLFQGSDFAFPISKAWQINGGPDLAIWARVKRAANPNEKTFVSFILCLLEFVVCISSVKTRGKRRALTKTPWSAGVSPAELPGRISNASITCYLAATNARTCARARCHPGRAGSTTDRASACHRRARRRAERPSAGGPTLQGGGTPKPDLSPPGA